jgi:hypothetical protein
MRRIAVFTFPGGPDEPLCPSPLRSWALAECSVPAFVLSPLLAGARVGTFLRPFLYVAYVCVSRGTKAPCL